MRRKLQPLKPPRPGSKHGMTGMTNGSVSLQIFHLFGAPRCKARIEKERKGRGTLQSALRCDGFAIGHICVVSVWNMPGKR